MIEKRSGKLTVVGICISKGYLPDMKTNSLKSSRTFVMQINCCKYFLELLKFLRGRLNGRCYYIVG